MKKEKKLTLDEIKVKSFRTSEDAAKLKGGLKPQYSDATDCDTVCHCWE